MDYTINLRSILLLIAMVQALVIAGLLLLRGKRRRQTADFFLAAFLFFLACSLIEHFIGFMGVYDYAREQGHDLTFFPFDNPFAYGPLLLLYIRALTDGAFQWKRSDAWHFLLPLLYYVVHFYVWAMPDADKFHLLGETRRGWLLQGGAAVLFYTSIGWYLAQAFRRYHAYRQMIEAEYSNTGKMTLDWLYVFLLALGAYLLIDLLFNVVASYYNFWYTGWYWLNLTRAILLYYISATGWAYAQKSNVPFHTLEKRGHSEQKTDSAAVQQQPGNGKLPIPAAELVERRKQLAAFMETQKPWLDPELTLSSLAPQLALNTTQLSYLVNTGFQQNFNDFVNTYRVEEVKRKLATVESQHLSLLGLAFESGFNSKATFNRAFKKLTGQAPKTFLPS